MASAVALPRPLLLSRGCQAARYRLSASPLPAKRTFSARSAVRNQRPDNSLQEVKTSRAVAGTANASSPIVVLGGGIAGLTATLQLARSLPSTKQIVLLEQRNVLGGWIQSERVQLPSGKGTALIEGGPRSLRPKGVAGWRMLELAFSLGLKDRMIIVPNTAPSAKNRFIWFRGQLNKLPSSLPAFLVAALRLPVIRSLIGPALFGLLREPFRPSRFLRPKSESQAEVQRQRSREYLLDESIESFVRRRFGDAFGGRLANNVLSAVIHGIYAADTRKLSVRSTLPFLWNTEQKHGSLLRAILPPKWNKRYRAPTDMHAQAAREEQDEMEQSRRSIADGGASDVLQRLNKASVFSFKDGIGELTEAMKKELAGYSNVAVHLGEAAESMAAARDGVQLHTSSGKTLTASHIISALPSTTLRATLGDNANATVSSILSHNPSTNVSVANIVIPSSAAGGASRPIKCEEGFGFLIPRAENDSNPDGILGVVFDSDAIPGQDECEEAMTKVTVMIGGPHYAREKALPTEEEVKQRALRALEKHLSIPRSITEHPNTFIKVTTQRNCIPTYLPGHYSRMRTLHEQLSRGSILNGRLSVAGASYIGVSLNDIVRHSLKLAEAIASAEKQRTPAPTGLESFRL